MLKLTNSSNCPAATVTSGGCRGVTPLGRRFTSQHFMNVDTERYVQIYIYVYFVVIIIPFDVSFFFFLTIMCVCQFKQSSSLFCLFQQSEQLFLTESSTDLVALNDLF